MRHSLRIRQNERSWQSRALAFDILGDGLRDALDPKER
jgi:hypothetical protein